MISIIIKILYGLICVSLSYRKKYKSTMEGHDVSVIMTNEYMQVWIKMESIGSLGDYL